MTQTCLTSKTFFDVKTFLTSKLFDVKICLTSKHFLTSKTFLTAYGLTQSKQTTMSILSSICWFPGRSIIAHRHVIDRIERIIEPTEPNLTKNPNFVILFFRRFFGLQASYRAETLTPGRSRAPWRFQKIENHTESTEPVDPIDRSRHRSYRPTAAMVTEDTTFTANPNFVWASFASNTFLRLMY